MEVVKVLVKFEDQEEVKGFLCTYDTAIQTVVVQKEFLPKDCTWWRLKYYSEALSPPDSLKKILECLPNIRDEDWYCWNLLGTAESVLGDRGDGFSLRLDISRKPRGLIKRNRCK